MVHYAIEEEALLCPVSFLLIILLVIVSAKTDLVLAHRDGKLYVSLGIYCI
jgi:hypothetical protein